MQQISLSQEDRKSFPPGKDALPRGKACSTTRLASSRELDVQVPSAKDRRSSRALRSPRQTIGACSALHPARSRVHLQEPAAVPKEIHLSFTTPTIIKKKTKTRRRKLLAPSSRASPTEAKEPLGTLHAATVNRYTRSIKSRLDSVISSCPRCGRNPVGIISGMAGKRSQKRNQRQSTACRWRKSM